MKKLSFPLLASLLLFVMVIASCVPQSNGKTPGQQQSKNGKIGCPHIDCD